MLWMFQRVMLGKIDKPENRSLADWTLGERWALAPLVLLIFWIGLYPNPFFRALNPSVKTVMVQTEPGVPDKSLATSVPIGTGTGLVAQGARK